VAQHRLWFFIIFISQSEQKYPQNSVGIKSGFSKQRSILIYLNIELLNCRNHAHKPINLRRQQIRWQNFHFIQ